MVIAQTARKIECDQPLIVKAIELPEDELRWCTVSLKEVIAKGQRLEASVFDIEGKHAREVLSKCKWPLKMLAGKSGLADAYHRPRFKRVWLEYSTLPIFQPSQIQEVHPKPKAFLSSITQTDVDRLRVHKNQILLTCSGTIGNSTYVGKMLDHQIFSHDLVRITAREPKDAGYIYAFMRTKVGQTLIKTNEYGAVISHIEPEHLASVPLPNPPTEKKRQIHNLISSSFDLRDKSNRLMDKAQDLLYESLELPSIYKLKSLYFEKQSGIRNYDIKLSQLCGRLDASYHIPLVDTIVRRLKKGAKKLTTIKDPTISKRVILPGRFARVYVDEGQGTVFFGGKQLYELDPGNKKYLSLIHHAERIKNQLTIKENMIMITCSGTIGKVVIAPRHWEGWTANQHIIRVVPANSEIAGYLYAFLASDYGKVLITRSTYGAVVDEITDHHVGEIVVPLLKNKSAQTKINGIVLKANNMRADAYEKEQEAIRLVNDEVIYASP